MNMEQKMKDKRQPPLAEALHDLFNNVASLVQGELQLYKIDVAMHPPLTLHKHPMCAEIIEEFQKCHLDHPIAKFWGECTELKIKLDRCFRQEKAINRKANFEASKRSQERLRATRAAMKSANLESPSPSDAAD